MAKIAKVCFLQCLSNSSKRINLPHQKIVYLGRSKETGINDPTISRKQVAVTANYDTYTVEVEPLGVNYSGCNGYALRKHGKYHLKHGDHLELRIGCYEFEINFHPTPETNESSVSDMAELNPKRRKTDQNNEPSTSNSSRSVADNWESINDGELLIYTSGNVQSQPKIAAFDLDGTIIKTKSGARFAKNADDWMIIFPEVSKKLPELINSDHKIVVFTNQGGIKSNPAKVNEFKKKIEAVVKAIKVPVQVFISTRRGLYRKPAPGMWFALTKEKNDGLTVDIAGSFFVGDAAGREKNWAPKKNKDHSTGDRLFALNLGLKFYTPEEYFLGARSVSFVMPKFDPRNLKSDCKLVTFPNKCEAVIMVGCPGSGKSHYCKNYLIDKGYSYANRDLLGSWQECVKVLEKALNQKHSIVIDNTNPNIETRKRYIDAVKKFNVACRCFVMTTSEMHCKHNNRFREIIDKTHVQVGDVIINMFKKQYQEPTLAEGFEEVVKIDFAPKFENDEHEKLYKMFILES